jgi:Asp-tRNA(Asn)/Glu-tRNA(Gln) amidotransferase A subunit family amidase
MLTGPSPLATLKTALADGSTTPLAIAEDSIAHANANAGHNTYIHFDPDALLRQAETLPAGTPLYGVPISLKDLFDLQGTITTGGSSFYAAQHAPATADSAIASALKASGALITGKTHLHPLAYGLTGENPDFGDCTQPRDSTLLTGGSSSGAVASVQEGSALAAIGTDTGGSVRIPAALCGLAGFRASLGLPALFPGLWSGGLALAQSFDTVGLFTRDPRDLAPIGQTLFRIPEAGAPKSPRIGCVPISFAADANADCLAAYEAWKQHLEKAGATIVDFDPIGWDSALEIYAAIQAQEAFLIHRRYLDALEPTLEPRIAQRLRWGQSLTQHDIDSLRSRHAYFRAAVARQLAQFDFLMLPSAPVNRLLVGADYTEARAAILRYTTPFSLAGLPVVTLPGEIIGAPFGTGVQLAAPQLEDGVLLAFAANLF